jgi:hypothetical protein
MVELSAEVRGESNRDDSELSYMSISGWNLVILPPRDFYPFCSGAEGVKSG